MRFSVHPIRFVRRLGFEIDFCACDIQIDYMVRKSVKFIKSLTTSFELRLQFELHNAQFVEYHAKLCMHKLIMLDYLHRKVL